MKGLTKIVSILLPVLLAVNVMKAETPKRVYPGTFSSFTTKQDNYIFGGLDTVPVPKGSRLFFKLPGGYDFSRNPGLRDDPASRDVSPGTGNTDLFMLISAQSTMDIDAGIIPPPVEILPLHRLELHTSVKQESVQLKWIAANELTTSIFMIQKSLDGVNYQSIGSIPTRDEINTPTAYFFLDNAQVGGEHRVFYRIMEKDNANRVACSNICQVKFNNQRGISVWPTLFDEAIRISYYSSTAGMITADLCDNAGRVVWENNFTVTRGYNQLSATGLDLLTPGIYYFNLRDTTTNRSFQQKMVKQ